MTAEVTPDDARLPRDTGPLLTVSGLRVGFPTRSGVAVVVNDVDLSLGHGEVLGLVGESGSGKSMTCRALIGLVPHPGAIIGGQIEFAGRDLTRLDRNELRRVRARDVAMVFQDSMSALNPVFTIGHQLSEVLRVNHGLDRRSAHTRALGLLERVGIPAAEERLRAYPHQLSGGMRQRVTIAMAIAGSPRLLIADEPTTALDVTIQHQVLRLVAELRRESDMSIILVSHDMGVIAELADRVAVMYAGHVVEVAPADVIFSRPSHPYTRALIEQIPRLNADRNIRLQSIGGQPPVLSELAPGCPFGPRCRSVRPSCVEVTMELIPVADQQLSACPFEIQGAAAEQAGS
jgi:oligopeptide/dipeptide ABC transporter ATP-binding protein